MILLFLLIFALAISVMLLSVFMKIMLVLCSIFLVAYIILLIVLSKKNLFRRFTEGWEKYAMIALKIFVIVEIVINSSGIITSLCYLPFMGAF